MICKVCNKGGRNKRHRAREMMFGYRDKFDYVECTRCGCVRIEAVPRDLERYYPREYGSFETNVPIREGAVRAFLRHQRAKHCLGQTTIAGSIVTKMAGIPPMYEWFRRCGLDLESRVLDLGCGVGSLLLMMRREGFLNLTGVDPFIENDIHYDNGVKIIKSDVFQVEGRFDLIMLNHSFEHVPDPQAVLERVHHLLGNDRYALLRIPLADSYAWRKYGVDWVYFDAPRHLFLHTRASIQTLARRVGFRIRDVTCDSEAVQFWASEQYKRDIPFHDPRSYATDKRSSIFTRDEIECFKAMADELNRNNAGDTACFYLYKE